MIGEAVAKGAAFLATIAVARNVSPDEFGRFSFVLALVGVGMLVTDVGLQVAATRLIAADRPRANRYLGAALLLGEVFSLLGYLVLVGAAAAGLLPVGTGIPTAIFAVVLFLTAALNPYWSVLRGFDRQDLVYVAYSVSSLVLLGGVVLVLAFDASIETVFLVYLGAYALRVVASLIATRVGVGLLRPRFERGAVRTLVVAAPVVTAAFVLLGIYSHVDIVLLGFLVPAADVGDYSAAYRLVDAVTFLTAGALTAVAFPLFARLAATSLAPAQELYDRLVRLLVAVLAPGALLVAALAAPVVELIYGADFERADRLLVLLSPSILLIGVNYLTAFFALGVGRSRVAVWGTGSAAVLNIAVVLVAVPLTGVEAAAAATFVAEVLMVLVFGLALARSGAQIRVLAPVALGMALVLVPFGLSEAFEDARVPILLAGAAIAVACAWAGGLVHRGDVASVRRALRR